MRLFKSICSLFLVAAPMALFAHDGHGAFSGGDIAHYLTSPGHAIPLVAVAAVAYFVIRRARKAARQ